MTRKSKREIERSIDDLDESGPFSLQDYLWADLKDFYDGDLSADERRLLENPGEHLSPTAKRQLAEWRETL
jgi:hypothetical protein